MSSNFKASLAMYNVWTIRIATGSGYQETHDIKDLLRILRELGSGVYATMLFVNDRCHGTVIVTKTKSGLFKEERATAAFQGFAQYCNEDRTTEKSEETNEKP